MVPGRVAATAAPRSLLLAALAIALVAPATAGADNRRIAIGDYRWSDPAIEIDSGEHVTWYWIGPDTMHSITGTSANSANVDTDPGTNQPQHKVGDQFQLALTDPGTYSFHCKLHSTVRGTVTVSATPGDPVAEPDPVPKSNVDLSAPRLRALELGATRFGRRGTSLRFSLGEDAKVSADYYRYDDEGRRHFSGYANWPAHTGFNGIRLATNSKHFDPRPGSYLAVLRATDVAKNVSDTRRVKFQIRRR